MEKAWMLRQDGKAIPVICHIYGNLEDDEETIFATEWLYKNTLNKETKDLCLKYISSWGKGLGINNASDNILSYIKNLGYNVISKDFVIIHKVEIDSIEEKYTVELLRMHIYLSLNQEFMRVRIGGSYNSNDMDGKELWFRVSSFRYDWLNIAKEFCNKVNFDVKYVSLIQDVDEYLPQDCYLYYIVDNTLVNHIEKEKFLYLHDDFDTGEKPLWLGKALGQGMPFAKIFTRINTLRAYEMLQRDFLRRKKYEKGEKR